MLFSLKNVNQKIRKKFVGIVLSISWLTTGLGHWDLLQSSTLGVNGGDNRHRRICVRVLFAIREETVTPRNSRLIQDPGRKCFLTHTSHSPPSFLSLKASFLHLAALSCCSVPSSESSPWLWGTSGILHSCSGSLMCEHNGCDHCSWPWAEIQYYS